MSDRHYEPIGADDPRPTRLVEIEGNTYRVYGDPVEEAVLVRPVTREGEETSLVNHDLRSGFCDTDIRTGRRSTLFVAESRKRCAWMTE